MSGGGRQTGGFVCSTEAGRQKCLHEVWAVWGGVSGGEEVVWEGEGVQVLLLSDEEERIQNNNVVANKEERKLFINEGGAARGGSVEEESDYRSSTVRVGEVCNCGNRDITKGHL